LSAIGFKVESSANYYLVGSRKSFSETTGQCGPAGNTVCLAWKWSNRGAAEEFCKSGRDSTYFRPDTSVGAPVLTNDSKLAAGDISNDSFSFEALGAIGLDEDGGITVYDVWSIDASKALNNKTME
jgi:hypothetical protein